MLAKEDKIFRWVIGVFAALGISFAIAFGPGYSLFLSIGEALKSLF